MKVVITGGCGFVGHHVVEHFLKNTDAQIIVIDGLSYASAGYDRLNDIGCFDGGRAKVFSVDLSNPLSCGVRKEIGDVDYILNLASESHVDRSIEYPDEFIRNNVMLAVNVLDWARTIPGLKRFLQFSTDEVFGPAEKDKFFKEGDPHNPGNPYSASKSAQEAICSAYANTYGLPIIITNTMNIFGERQHPEKFIPMVIRKVRDGERVNIHSDKTGSVIGSRFYIHARNVADAICFILENNVVCLSKTDPASGRYNIVGEREIDNITLAKTIAEMIGRPLSYETVDFHSSRPGHDLRYALDGSKLSVLGWSPPAALYESLRKVVEWELRNPEWLEVQP
jgi:dTDP-glucose 4,6-dehydratase